MMLFLQLLVKGSHFVMSQLIGIYLFEEHLQLLFGVRPKNLENMT